MWREAGVGGSPILGLITGVGEAGNGEVGWWKGWFGYDERHRRVRVKKGF